MGRHGCIQWAFLCVSVCECIYILCIYQLVCSLSAPFPLNPMGQLHDWSKYIATCVRLTLGSQNNQGPNSCQGLLGGAQIVGKLTQTCGACLLMRFLFHRYLHEWLEMAWLFISGTTLAWGLMKIIYMYSMLRQMMM